MKSRIALLSEELWDLVSRLHTLGKMYGLSMNILKTTDNGHKKRRTKPKDSGE